MTFLLSIIGLVLFWALAGRIGRLLGRVYAVADRWLRFGIALFVGSVLALITSKLAGAELAKFGVVPTKEVYDAYLAYSQYTQYIVGGILFAAAYLIPRRTWVRVLACLVTSAIFFIIVLTDPVWLTDARILIFLPVAAVIFLTVLGFVSPALVAVVALFEDGRTVLRGISAVIMTLIFIGGFVWLVPIENDPSLVWLLALGGIGLLFARLAIKGGLQGWSRLGSAAFVLLILGLLLVFLLGGRSGVTDKWEKASGWVGGWFSGVTATSTAAAAPAVSRAVIPVPPPLTIEADREGFIEVPRGTPMVTVPVQPDKWSSWLVLNGRCETDIFYEDDSQKPELKVWGKRGVRILPPDRPDEGVTDDVQKLCFRGPAQVVKIYFNWR